MSDFINTIEQLGEDVVIDSIIDRTITELKDDVIKVLGDSAFAGCGSLTDVDLPNCTSATGTSHFSKCVGLENVNLPLLENTVYSMFYGCIALKSIALPSVKTLLYAFDSCHFLERVDLPSATYINTIFLKCTSLKGILLRSETLCAISRSNVIVSNQHFHFYGTYDATYNPDSLQDGYVYVPKALVESYQTATNWATIYAAIPNVFRALEDYTVDGTITGELDESKI